MVSTTDAMMLNRQPEDRNWMAMPGQLREACLADRLALRVVQTGAIAVVLAASLHRMFDLDRFFVPKELVLHATALIAGLLTIRFMKRSGWVDLALVAYLLLSVASAVFATNHWLGMRAVAVSASGILLFFVARALREAGLARPLLNGLALAVVIACVTALLQAYGVRPDLFALNRAPGGTLGNRNFVAHAAAFGFPLLLLVALRARTLLPSLGVPVAIATLVLTRSRAAWLAFAAMALVFLLVIIMRRAGVGRRMIAVMLFIGAGVAAALLVPNTLRWRSDNPYLDSVRDVANYQEGSGRGRLIQYQHSLRMALAHPLLGAGTGNWSVEYPNHAARNDPSLDTSADGMTFNPWPSSDWVAFVSERGFIAAILLVCVFAGIARSGFRHEDPLVGAVLLAAVVAAGIVGLFDAVLLLPLPAFLVWTALGALSGGQAILPVQPVRTSGPGRIAWAPLMLLLIILSALGAVRSTSQLVAMELYTQGRDLQRASRIDPGNYRLRMRLARGGKRAQRCAHARAAHALFPHAEAARAASARCD